jgi:hypothetical protein
MRRGRQKRGKLKKLLQRSACNNDSGAERKRFALLGTNPAETTDLYLKHPEIVREMKVLLESSKT